MSFFKLFECSSAKHKFQKFFLFQKTRNDNFHLVSITHVSLIYGWTVLALQKCIVFKFRLCSQMTELSTTYHHHTRGLIFCVTSTDLYPYLVDRNHHSVVKYIALVQNVNNSIKGLFYLFYKFTTTKLVILKNDFETVCVKSHFKNMGATWPTHSYNTLVSNHLKFYFLVPQFKTEIKCFVVCHNFIIVTVENRSWNVWNKPFVVLIPKNLRIDL